MTDPASLDILEALVTRLEAIDQAGGYNTNAGEHVYLGRRQTNPDELAIGPSLQVYDSGWTADEVTAHGSEEIHATMNITVAAAVLDTYNEGPRLAHLVIQDVVNAALTATDQTLGGLSLDIGFDSVATEYPDPGGDTIAILIEFTVLFLMPYGAT